MGRHTLHSKTRTCECGNPKSDKRDIMCSRCAFLDGRYNLERRVIQVLRQNIRSTQRELIRLTGSSQRAVITCLKHLRKAGRVKVLTPDNADYMCEAKLYELVTRKESAC